MLPCVKKVASIIWDAFTGYMPRSVQPGCGADVAIVLYERSGAALYGVSADQFAAILHVILCKYCEANPNSAHASAEQQADFCARLHLEELVLARACAAGNERAWQDFISRYRHKLHRMALHITRDGAHAAELADSLFADLYGVNAREGVREFEARLLHWPRFPRRLAAHGDGAGVHQSLS